MDRTLRSVENPERESGAEKDWIRISHARLQAVARVIRELNIFIDIS